MAQYNTGVLFYCSSARLVISNRSKGLWFGRVWSSRGQNGAAKDTDSPAPRAAPRRGRLARRALPLAVRDLVERRPQAEQVEGFVTLVTQDQLVVLA